MGNKEEWREIKGYEGLYMVSDKGNIKGTIRSGSNGQILKPQLTHNGYLSIKLYDHMKSKGFLVHRLVALAFLPNDENKRTVNHKDGNKQNNCVENLEWATYSENHKHAYRIGLKKPSDKQRAIARITGAKTCEKNRKRTAVIAINAYGEELFFTSAHEAARSVCGDASPIIKCCKGKKKTYKEYRWRYA